MLEGDENQNYDKINLLLIGKKQYSIFKTLFGLC